jgi:putative phosphoesterase
VLVALIADTHLPRGTRALPSSCVERLRAADLIVHAGDLSSLQFLEELRDHGAAVAVQGNVDEAAVRALLPTTLELDLDGHRVAVIHDAGPRRGRLERLRRRFPRARAVIFGHSHMPVHERGPDGFQIFNPGSPTERRRAARHTMGMARADARGLQFELVELD